MSAGIAISGQQRNLLYEVIEMRVSAASDIYRNACTGELRKADELARLVRDALTFVSGDLGWGRNLPKAQQFEITTPPSVVRRVLDDILKWHSQADAIRELLEEARQMEERDEAIAAACNSLVNRLDEAEAK